MTESRLLFETGLRALVSSIEKARKIFWSFWHEGHSYLPVITHRNQRLLGTTSIGRIRVQNILTAKLI